jgi:hypothetical protein
LTVFGQEIVNFHCLSKSTVKHVKRQYNAFIAGGGLPEDFETTRKDHKRRSNTLDVSITADIQELVNQDPGRSMRSMARELGLANSTVQKKMTLEIHYKSYALRKGQFMNAATKERRLAKAKLLLNRLKVPAANGQLIFFSDKKNFSQNQKVNRKITGGSALTSLRSQS